MSKEVGRDLGNKLGKYIESDKRSWLSEQAKFMRIRVDLPINKLLRRGGNIVNPNGGKFWVTFKYEKFLVFAFNVAFLVMMKNIALGSQAILKLSGNMGTD